MILRVSIVLFLVTVVGLLIYFTFRLAYPFIIAAGFAFLLNPLVNLLTKKLKIPRGLSVLISILLLFGVLGSIIFLLILKIIEGIEYLSLQISGNIETSLMYINSLLNQNVIPLWEEINQLFNNLNNTQQVTVQEYIQEYGLELATFLGKVGQALANGLSQFISVLPITITAILFILIAMYFISKDWDRIGEFLKGAIPPTYYQKMQDINHELKTKVVGFFIAQIILISLSFVIIIVGFMILQIENALTIAVIAAVLDFLPYLGTGLIFVPWIIYCLITGNYFLAFGLMILYALVLVQRQLAEPKVLSSNLGINPLATLISLFIGLQLFGFVGLIIGPVTLVILVALYHAGILQGIELFIKGTNEK
ncbi:sporulation integral membrane protein YtvI [Alkalihalobacillus sp. BA299]|uniref:sporulation integral membrane protein YtvI n=1 Tax=Alkalihalobacillus sp. BA299 TaxID=2815938 RepID=UPI001FFE2A3B|nr:sporulation integral membrane protein YtvI [Alkalihalobacillus sp. BA299]